MKKLACAVLVLGAMTGIASADGVILDDGKLDRVTAGAPLLIPPFLPTGSLPTSLQSLLPGFGLVATPAGPDDSIPPIAPIAPFGPIPGGKTTTVATNGSSGFASCLSAGTCVNSALATPTSLTLSSSGKL